MRCRPPSRCRPRGRRGTPAGRTRARRPRAVGRRSDAPRPQLGPRPACRVAVRSPRQAVTPESGGRGDDLGDLRGVPRCPPWDSGTAFGVTFHPHGTRPEPVRPSARRGTHARGQHLRAQRRALRRPSGHPLRRADVDPRRLLHRELPVRPALPGPPAGWAFHVGVLLDNTPDYLFALGAAAVGATVVGLNPTRQGEHLAVMPSTPMSACCSPSRAISTSSSPFVPDGASTTIASSCRSASTIRERRRPEGRDRPGGRPRASPAMTLASMIPTSAGR